MKRSGRIARHKALRASGRIAPRARTKAERERIYGPDERIKWMQQHGCVACARTPCEVAHAKNGGTGRKADAALTLPLCHFHHAELHRVGVKTFETLWDNMLAGLTLVQWAGRYDAAWSRFMNPEPIGSVVPRVVAVLRDGREE